MKTEICSFSGYKIYPGRGKTYVRGDSKTFKFISSKVESYSLQRLNPRKIAWTIVYRKMHKKGITEEAAKKRSRKAVRSQRAIVGASWEAIRAKRNQKPEVRQQQREQAIKDAKEKKKVANASKIATRGTEKAVKQVKGARPTKAMSSSKR